MTQPLTTTALPNLKPSTPPSIHQLFEDQVARSPDKTAVNFNGKTLSYQALNARANQIAHHLQQVGISAGSSVGLCTERSIERVVALLGLLKAGVTAVPIHPNESQDGIFSIVKAAQISAVLTQKSIAQRLARAPLDIILLDKSGHQSQLSPHSACHLIDNHPIYHLYNLTTAYAKIATLTHRALCNAIWWQNQHPNRLTALRTLQFSNLSEHTFSQEIFTTWTTGGCLHLIGEAAKSDPYRLFESLQQQSIERIFLSNRDLQRLAIAATDYAKRHLSLKEIIITGAPLQITPAAREFFRELSSQPAGCTVHHHYGNATTHVAIASSPKGDPSQWPASLPIGQPISIAQVSILDSQQRSLPAGIPGDLYVAAADQDIASKAHRTGDIACYLPSRDIELMGTTDQQIEIEGVSINLRDIEVALNQHDSVSEAIVIPKTDSSKTDSSKTDAAASRQRLVAYLLPSEKRVAVKALRQHIKSQLSERCIPDTFVWLRSVPLTLSGNIDYLALLKLSISSNSTTSGEILSGEIPTTANRIKNKDIAAESLNKAPDKNMKENLDIEKKLLEKKLLALWQQAFGHRNIGIHDDFFDLGGHSLIAASVVADVQSTLDSTITVRTLFEHPTIHQLAQHLGDTRSSPPPAPSFQDTADQKTARRKPTPASKTRLTSWQKFSFMIPRCLGDRPALFCIHPAGGSVSHYVHLSKALGTSQPFYSIRSPGLDNIELAPKTVEDTAALYVQAIKSEQPEGPYYISGWSLGGVIAYEIARQLQFQGHEVPLLAVFDTRTMVQAAHPASTREEDYLKYFLVQLPDFFLAQNPNKNWKDFQQGESSYPTTIEGCIEKMKAAGIWPKGLRAGRFNQMYRVFQVNMRAVANYRLRTRSYSGKTVLWKATDQQYISTVYRNIITSGSQEDLGWTRWTDNLTIYQSPANHYTLLTMPHVAQVVNELRLYLA